MFLLVDNRGAKRELNRARGGDTNNRTNLTTPKCRH
jgi:hypothetical protein